MNTPPKLAFCFCVKDRWNWNIGEEYLSLLPMALFTLNLQASKFTNDITYYIYDFNSTDSGENDIRGVIGEVPNLVYMRPPKNQSNFNKGKGYNIIIDEIKKTPATGKYHKGYDMIGFIDADMVFLRDEVLKIALHYTSQNVAFCPKVRDINEDGSLAESTKHGTGNIFLPGDSLEKPLQGDWGKEDSSEIDEAALANIGNGSFLRYAERELWGQEDEAFLSQVHRIGQVVRLECKGFLHQWHPTPPWREKAYEVQAEFDKKYNEIFIKHLSCKKKGLEVTVDKDRKSDSAVLCLGTAIFSGGASTGWAVDWEGRLRVSQSDSAVIPSEDNIKFLYDYIGEALEKTIDPVEKLNQEMVDADLDIVHR